MVGYDINLKVDFVKYWLGSRFIDEVFIKRIDYRAPDSLSENLNKGNRVSFKSLTQSMYIFLNKIESDSILVDKGTLKLQNQIFNFEKIFLFKDKKSLAAKAILKFKPNGNERTYAAKVNFSLNPENILVFNVDLQEFDYNSFISLKDVPKVLRLFLGRLTEISDFSDKKRNKVNGEVILKIYKGNITILSRRSKNKAYSLKKVSFEENKTFKKTKIEKFIKFHSKQLHKQ